MSPFGNLFSFQIVMALPLSISKVLIDWVSDKAQIVFSNAHMTKVPLCINGHTQRQDVGSFYYASTPGLNNCSFTICTMGDAMGIAVFCDKNSKLNPKEFLEIFVKKYKLII
jgi:hypothetical protein